MGAKGSKQSSKQKMGEQVPLDAQPVVQDTTPKRKFNVVVWGATGFTGALVCKHIAEHYHKVCFALCLRTCALILYKPSIVSLYHSSHKIMFIGALSVWPPGVVLKLQWSRYFNIARRSSLESGMQPCHSCLE